MWIYSMFKYRYRWKRGLRKHPRGACGHVTVLKSSERVVMKKGASKTVKVLVAETNHVGRLHGWEIWNRPGTLSVMTKRDWSSIHIEVKEDESMKIHSGGVGSRMEQNKEGKTLTALSCLLIIYVYICLCIVKTKDCWMHV